MEMVPQEGLLAGAPGRRAGVERSPKPGLGARVLSRLRWFSLDARIAAGEDPSSSALLAAHAVRLTSARRREQVADALHGLLRAAEQGPRLSRVSPSGSALLSNERALTELARRLDSRLPVYARGVARLELLLSDSTGPAYRGGVSALAEQLALAAAELEGATTHAERAADSDTPRGPRSPWRRNARRARRVARGAAAPSRGSVGSSFSLPGGSWYHGRRDAA